MTVGIAGLPLPSGIRLAGAVSQRTAAPLFYSYRRLMKHKIFTAISIDICLLATFLTSRSISLILIVEVMVPGGSAPLKDALPLIFLPKSHTAAHVGVLNLFCR